MITILSPNGHIVLPARVRQQLHLEPGDRFEVFLDGADTVTLRRVSRPANLRLVDLLLTCPKPFDVPTRERDDPAPLEL